MNRPGLLSLAILLLSMTFGQAADPGGIAFFEKKIRPVLVEHCYSCHSAEAQAKKKLRGGLFLDSKKGLLDGGDSGPAIVPGKGKDSLLVKSLRHDGDVRMPPKQKLPDSVLADFITWIDRGAADPRAASGTTRVVGMSLDAGRRFWSYQPVAATGIPSVKLGSWPQGTLDTFLLSAMEAKGLMPSPEADRATLIRRLCYDLQGLPPTPEEIDAFVGDSRPDAYERLVDRLLASPRFGERWGRHWLDVARFAESLTLRGFILKEGWRYRDHVIGRFNEDAPFDRFVREQVAGDLLPAATQEEQRRQLTATAFLALGNTNLEEQDKKQLVMDVVDEQLETLGRAFLAQTIGCARCHDHKFDPIPTKDYYALAGILRNTRTLNHANVSMWIERPLPVEGAREKSLLAHESAVKALEEKVRSLRAAMGKNTRGGKTAGVVRKVGEFPGIVVDDHAAKKVGTWTDSKFSGSYIGDGYIHDGNGGKGEKTLTFQPEIPKSGRYEVRLAYVPGTNRAENVPVTVFSADGEKTLHIDQRKAPDIDGRFVSLGQYRFERSGQGFVLIANEDTKGHVIADAVQFLPVEQVAGKPAAQAEPGNAVQLRRLEADLKKLTQSGPRREMTLSVVEEKKIEEVRVHIRGNVHSLGEPAPRGFLRVTGGKAPPMPPEQSGRRELADWLASPDNPLTARVFVNRAWYWLTGEGIVRTTDNFGTTGEKPSHPELLDHLAAGFVTEGWSIKTLVRRIVLSRTYRQSSRGDERYKPIDPENRLFWHANRRRLDAESIRDTMLSVSGRLTPDMGGPSYRTDLATDYGFRHLDERRSVYTPVFRNSLPEIFEVFDFADPSVSTGRRNVSTVVPQALFLMNHPFVQEQARQSARRVVGEATTDEARLEKVYRWALGRGPSSAERTVALGYLAGTKQTEREEAWGQLIQAIFASLDFRYVD